MEKNLDFDNSNSTETGKRRDEFCFEIVKGGKKVIVDGRSSVTVQVGSRVLQFKIPEEFDSSEYEDYEDEDKEVRAFSAVLEGDEQTPSRTKFNLVLEVGDSVVASDGSVVKFTSKAASNKKIE